MQITIANKNITYLVAFDVITKILPGSKILNIIYFMKLLVRKIDLIKNVEGDNNEENLTLLIRICIKITISICLRFELIVFK